MASNFLIPNSWSSDGRRLALMNFIDKGRPQLQVYELDSRKLEPLAVGAEAQYSPDGKWISYIGGNTGTYGEIIVQSAGEGGTRITISSGGGAQARWSRDGKHLFYVTPDRKLMEVDFTVTSTRLVPSAPRKLFQTRISSPNFTLFQYDVSRDGRRFLINSFPDKPMPLTLLTNWPRLLATSLKNQ